MKDWMLPGSCRDTLSRSHSCRAAFVRRALRVGPLALAASLPGMARAHAVPEAAGALDAWADALRVVLPLVLAAVLYARGFAARLARGASQADRVRAAGFALGMLLLWVALVWPLDAWAARSFAAHMAQHMVLVVLAPPLLLAGRPTAVALRGLAPTLRQAFLAPRRWPGAGMVRRHIASIGAMSVLHGAVLWAWHVPAVFDAALRHDWLHWLEHVTLLASGLLFWRALIRARGLAVGRGMAALLLTTLHTGMLGAVLTLSPRVLYHSYAGPDALADQQLAGLIMWVPMGTVYLLAAMWLAFRALGGAQRLPQSP